MTRRFHPVFSTDVSSTSSVDFFTNFKLIRLVKYGFSTAAICSQLKLTPSQVSYRIGTFNLAGSRRDFRNADTKEATEIIQVATQTTAKVSAEYSKKFSKIRDAILASRRVKRP